MQKPINLKEHNRAFVKFIIFFLATLAIAITAVYFNFQLPQKELSILRQRSHLLRTQQINQENYKRTLGEVMQVFNKLDSGTSKAMIESELTVKLDALRTSASIEDSTSSQKLNQMVFSLVNEYSKARFSLFNFKDAEAEINKLKADIKDKSDQLDDCRNKFNFNNAR
jgi:hypothetical protein